MILKIDKNIKKRIIWILATIFLMINIVAYFHAYKFTHFSVNHFQKTKNPEKLSSLEKIRTLIFGINNPRPENKRTPDRAYKSIRLKSNKTIDCWDIKVDSALGTMLIFHGYSGEKSSMLDKSEEFNKLGYNTVLVDFMGSGGSEGNQTSLGFWEAEEVRTVYEHYNNGQKMYLFGTSMGAVAIMKAIYDYDLKPSGLIIECPFGTMYQTVSARFKVMKAPSFPMAGLLVFWGGIQNGFWAFSHNPIKYAKKITMPTLLLYGECDRNVSRQEINDIYANLNCDKYLRTYPLAEHENYLLKYKDDWIKDIKEFLSTKNPAAANTAYKP